MKIILKIVSFLMSLILSNQSVVPIREREVLYGSVGALRGGREETTETFQGLSLHDEEQTLKDRCIACLQATQKIVEDPKTDYLSLMGSTIAIIAAAVLVSPLLNEYADSCAKELNTFSANLTSCGEPYTGKIQKNLWLLGVGSGVFGYTLEKLLTDKTNSHPAINDLGKQIDFYRTKYAYELHLFTGYLFNGLWLSTNSSRSWEIYLHCQVAGMTLAMGMLGMYLRFQQMELLELLDKPSEELTKEIKPLMFEDYWKSLLFSGAAATACIGLIPSPNYPGTYTEEARIARELLFMFAMRFPALIGASWIKNHEQETNVLNYLSAGLDFSPTLLAAIGSMIYSSTADENVKILGMLFFGAAHGVKDAYYQCPYISLPPEIQVNPDDPYYKQGINLVEKYGPSLCLAALSLSAPFTKFLDCFDVSTYDCPVSFELSKNYINIDGKGVGFMLGVGWINYHALQYFHRMSQQQMETIGGVYKHIQDKHQFDMLSLIPYAMVNSGRYISDFDAYASYNPYPLLFLIGWTFGTYKLQVRDPKNDAFRPVFTDISIVSRLFKGFE